MGPVTSWCLDINDGYRTSWSLTSSSHTTSRWIPFLFDQRLKRKQLGSWNCSGGPTIHYLPCWCWGWGGVKSWAAGPASNFTGKHLGSVIQFGCDQTLNSQQDRFNFCGAYSTCVVVLYNSMHHRFCLQADMLASIDLHAEARSLQLKPSMFLVFWGRMQPKESCFDQDSAALQKPATPSGGSVCFFLNFRGNFEWLFGCFMIFWVLSTFWFLFLDVFGCLNLHPEVLCFLPWPKPTIHGGPGLWSMASMAATGGQGLWELEVLQCLMTVCYAAIYGAIYRGQWWTMDINGV